MGKSFKRNPRDNYEDFYASYDMKRSSIDKRKYRKQRVNDKSYIPSTGYDTREERDMDREDY